MCNFEVHSSCYLPATCIFGDCHPVHVKGCGIQLNKTWIYFDL